MIEQSNPKIQNGRSLQTAWRALFEPRHYKAMKNILLCHTRPIEFLGRYAFSFGKYPSIQNIQLGQRELNFHVYSWHDILTLNEVFFRRDYPVSGDEKTIVDFGSNIGISAAFFLSAAEKSFCYLFEPLPANTLRLRQNLLGFESRYKLESAAVALSDGQESFGFEETGRYGGIGVKTGSYIKVPCLDAIRMLGTIISEHGTIDILKIDIEALEKEIIGAIPADLLTNIKRIFVEQSFASNPLPETHSYVQYGSVAQFSRKIGH
jgi:FkbM family methyltransferase